MKIRKHTQYKRTQHFPHRVQYPLHPDTMSDKVGQTHRTSTQNTESALGLATASNLLGSVFETSNQKNNF